MANEVRITLRSDLSTMQLNQELDRIWAEIQDEDAIAHSMMQQASISLVALPSTRTSVISVNKDGAGTDAVDLLVQFLGSASAGKVGWDLWNHVFLPLLRRKWGDNAIAGRRSRGDAVTQRQSAEKKNVQKSTSNSKK